MCQPYIESATALSDKFKINYVAYTTNHNLVIIINTKFISSHCFCDLKEI